MSTPVSSVGKITKSTERLSRVYIKGGEMDVRFQGFTFKIGSFKGEDFFNFLKSKEQQLYPFTGFDRLFKIIETENYYNCLLITIKTQKTLATLEEIDGEFVIDVASLKDKRLFDFNFLIVSKNKSSVIYQHYHNSLNCNQFCKFLRQRFEDYKRHLKDGLNTEQDAKKITEINRTFFNYTQYYKRDSFEKLTANLERIQRAKCSISSKEVINKVFTPLNVGIGNNLKDIKIEIHFDIKASHFSRLRSILKLKKIDSDKINVSGLDELGHLINYDSETHKNLDSFEEYSYNDIADKLKSVKLSDLNENHYMFKLLESTIKKNILYFE